MTNPAIRTLLPLSWARHDRLRSRSPDEDGANEGSLERPIVIARLDADEPPSLLAVTVTLYVPAPVGVPEMTPVVEFMLSPGGRPEAENEVGSRVAVTVKVNGMPDVPAACDAELMTGIARTFSAWVVSMMPDELYREDGDTPIASTRKVVDPVEGRPEIRHVAPSADVAWPADVKCVPSADRSNSTDESAGAPPPRVHVMVD
ncbi:MAG TPA: hypothetical protein VMG58_09160, partial [Candidatus Sulfotelmatobacter sp.]|nr:hypothetical protein [Candidatus Sulfotelmatobacter sp.]